MRTVLKRKKRKKQAKEISRLNSIKNSDAPSAKGSKNVEKLQIAHDHMRMSIPVY